MEEKSNSNNEQEITTEASQDWKMSAEDLKNNGCLINSD